MLWLSLSTKKLSAMLTKIEVLGNIYTILSFYKSFIMTIVNRDIIIY